MEQKNWNRRAAFERGIALSPELFAGERVLGIIEAGLGDTGWLGYLLRRKECLVVTTHRLLQYSADFMSANLKSLELAKVEAIEAGSRFNVARFAASIVLLLGAVLLVGIAMSQRNGKLLFIICSALSALAGLFALITSETKVLQVSGSSPQSFVRLNLSRLSVNESKSFIDLVCKAVRNLSKITAAEPAQPGRKTDKKMKNPRKRDDNRHWDTLMNQSYQEPAEEPRESLNGKDKPYRGMWRTPEPAFSPTVPELIETQEMPSNDDDYLEYRSSPPGEGWYRSSERNRRMYIE